MKETKKIIPFVCALLIAGALAYFNPSKEEHIERIKEKYIEESPRTWQATWWRYERSLEYRNYFFFSATKQKHRPITYGVLGYIITKEDDD